MLAVHDFIAARKYARDAEFKESRLLEDVMR